MTLNARIIRLEGRIIRGKDVDWQPYLAKLSDQQLDRFEALCVKMAGDEDDVGPVSDHLHALSADDVRELQDLVDAMGVDW